MITAVVLSGFSFNQGVTARDFASFLETQNSRIVGFVGALQQERVLSLRAAAGDSTAREELTAARKETDTAVSAMGVLAQEFQQIAPKVAAQSNPLQVSLATRLPVLRQSVDAQTAALTDVDDYYTQFVGVAMVGVEGTARTAADALSSSELSTAAILLSAADLHARAAGHGAAALSDGQLGADDRLTQAQLVGSYRTQLDAVASRLPDAVKSRYQELVSGSEWKKATEAEDQLARQGKAAVPTAEWLAAAESADAALLDLWGEQLEYAADVADDYAGEVVLQSIGTGVGVLLVTAAAFVVALRLANGFVRRLTTLGAKTLELAEDTLPAVMTRLRDGEPVDIMAEVPVIDQGGDEIGQVAQAFHTAQQTAFDAAAAETRTRSGFNKVFLDIAHRSQRVVQQQLAVLDTAEAKQSDPVHLELLFQLDHLATRARRNAENLVILGGGQPGRKWRNPVALEEIVRSAVSETEGFARVSAVRLPDTQVIGAVVADLLHLLAELVDNATSFSPPDSVVAVRGNMVGKGVVVEVEDQGLGIRPEALDRINAELRDPPDFQDMALAGRLSLGLFVTGRLAQRHGISVQLVESAYGGIRAIVLIPLRLLEARTDGGLPEPAADLPQRTGRRRKTRLVPEVVHDRIPRMPEQDTSPSLPWPADDAVGDPPLYGSAAGPHPESRADREPARRPEPEPDLRPTERRRRELPRRRRQEHLAPQLHLDDQSDQTSAPAPAPARRSPEEARAAMSSFQRGARQGRQPLTEHEHDNGTPRTESP